VSYVNQENPIERPTRRWREALAQPAGRAEVVAAAAVVIAAIAFGLMIERDEKPAGAFTGPGAVEGQLPSVKAPAAGPAKGEDSSGPLWDGGGFRIATVREGASVRVYERPGEGLVEQVGDRTEFGSLQTFSVMDRRRRWLQVTSEASPDNGPLWIPANRKVLAFDNTRVSVHADLATQTVELRHRGEVLHEFLVTIGAAGTSTPVGRFAVTDIFVEGLNPVYGCCAIALTAHQPNLPAGWIGGDRVAIHGTVGAVGGASSAGCLRATDEDARLLTEALRPGTPVFITA
jgi:hypothetical protein